VAVSRGPAEYELASLRRDLTANLSVACIKHAEYGVGIATGKSGVYEVEQFMVVRKFQLSAGCLPCLLILAATGIENP